MSFSMEVVNPEEIKQVIEAEVKPVPEEVSRLKQLAEANVDAILNLDLDATDQRRDIIQTIEGFGMGTVRSSSEKNAMLQVTINKLSKTGDEGGDVAKGLTELHLQLKDLDPSMIDFAKTGFLGKLFNPLRAYFAKYEKADVVISDIIASLDKGKTVLRNDNTTLQLEQDSLRELTKKLEKEIQLGTLMDQEIEARVELEKARGGDEDKIRFVTEEILFPLRQRLMDLQQMVVVNQQGIMAMEVVMRNNKELIRGVDRARNVTISALKISVTVAGALYNQKIVLKKIEMLNQTTDQLISATSSMLKNQGAAIHKQSLEANISAETLKQSFADVLSSLDAISKYKQDALPKMRETISTFRDMADEGEKHIERMEKRKALGF